MTEIIITGGAGFAGHHVVEHLLKNTDWNITVLDKLTYASSGLDRLRDIGAFDDSRVCTLTADFSLPLSRGVRKELGHPNYIIHMGAETHVDRSIEDPYSFVRANVQGTLNMLEYARSLTRLQQFVYFSTDEVFGPADPGVAYAEWDRYNSANPYAASKAGGEELALAYANTYKLPVLITHTMNLFGERQHPEKFIPKVIRSVLSGTTVPIHADKTKTHAGKRSYIHCRNMAAALLFLLQTEWQRDKVNIVGEKEVDNLEMAKMIAKIIGKPLIYEMVDFHSSRPGHDLRYALDGTKLMKLGWEHPKTFEESLKNTVLWTLQRPEWR
jgi:dTDP-glucose 4,6-dehydratase